MVSKYGDVSIAFYLFIDSTLPVDDGDDALAVNE